MLICYLDDSGQDAQNPITTIAGYVGTNTAWSEFEREVEQWFSHYEVNILHAKELESSRAEYKGWSVLKKQSFVSRICQVRNHHLTMGLSMSALKATYIMRAKTSGRKRTVTPYIFCMNVIVDWILRDIRMGGITNTRGVSLVLEAGNPNNGEAEIAFNEVRKLHSIEHLLHSISFVRKDSCRAIQMADLLAFYSRRDGVQLEKARRRGSESYRMSTMMRIIGEGLPHRGFVATDFGPDVGGAPFHFMANKRTVT